MAKVPTFGKMVGNTKDATTRTKKKALAPTRIPMEGNLKAIGWKVSSMERESSQVQEKSRGKELGKMGRG
tara:strand:- start:261 stop:470 length:210 start_codon:yes stop_codon:yes gene_type:complete